MCLYLCICYDNGKVIDVRDIDAADVEAARAVATKLTLAV